MSASFFKQDLDGMWLGSKPVNLSPKTMVRSSNLGLWSLFKLAAEFDFFPFLSFQEIFMGFMASAVRTRAVHIRRDSRP